MEIDLNKMITRGRIFNIKGNKIWVPLKYEKLLMFKCGRIVHESQGCIGTVKQGIIIQENNEQFGVWLSADTSTRRRWVDWKIEVTSKKKRMMGTVAREESKVRNIPRGITDIQPVSKHDQIGRENLEKLVTVNIMEGFGKQNLNFTKYVRIRK